MMKTAQASFERTEHYFRAVTSEAHLHKIDFASVISRSVCDVDVDVDNSVLSHSELMVHSDVAKDVLHNIILLYVKLHSFFFCKGH